MIRGIEDVVGKNIAIIGGSAADDHVQGKWQIFNQEQQTQQGIGIAVFYPNCEVSFSFLSTQVMLQLHIQPLPQKCKVES